MKLVTMHDTNLSQCCTAHCAIKTHSVGAAYCLYIYRFGLK